MNYGTSYGFRHFARHLFLNSKKIEIRAPQLKVSRLEEHIEGSNDYILLKAQPSKKPDIPSIRKKLALIQRQLQRMPAHSSGGRLLRKVKALQAAIKGL